MPVYICENKECPNHGMIKSVARAIIKIKGYEVVDEAAFCPECGKVRRTYKNDGFTTAIHGGKNIPI